MTQDITLEEFKKRSFDYFDASFMVDENVEERKRYREVPRVNEFLEEAYRRGWDSDVVDTCLMGMWKTEVGAGNL